MSDFRMPDSWYEPPDEPEECEHCDDGCHRCDDEAAADYHADLQHQAMKEEPELYGRY